MADQIIDDLLEGLDGTARAERAELVEWLLGEGITLGATTAGSRSLLEKSIPLYL